MNTDLAIILPKLNLLGEENTTKKIQEIYEKKESCIVHFLYFANILLNKLDREYDDSPKKQAFIAALTKWDFLLPDGIALKLLYKKYFRKDLPNLNGTDFLPYFLSNLSKWKKVEIIVYGGTEEVVKKSVDFITKSFMHRVSYAVNGFTHFDWTQIPPRENNVIRILLVGRWSPLQELWTEENRQQIEAMKCLVFTVGGLLDFWAWTEKRAPKWARNLKIEWLYRALSHPKKNLKKTLVSLKLMKFLISSK